MADEIPYRKDFLPVNESATPTLRPCPFCGSVELTVEGAPDERAKWQYYLKETPFAYAVFCANREGQCGCGPTGATPEEASDLWNRRELTAALAQQKGEPQTVNTAAAWIPVSERMPKEGDKILVWNTRNYEADDYARPDWFKSKRITHWMPLPSAPGRER